MITIDKRKTGFCFGCFYLIRIWSEKGNAKTSLLIHNKDSSVGLRILRSVHEIIKPDDYEEFSYSSGNSFNIKVDVISGTALVSVSKGEKKIEIVKPQKVEKQGIIPVEHTNRKHIHGYDSEN